MKYYVTLCSSGTFVSSLESLRFSLLSSFFISPASSSNRMCEFGFALSSAMPLDVLTSLLARKNGEIGFLPSPILPSTETRKNYEINSVILGKIFVAPVVFTVFVGIFFV